MTVSPLVALEVVGAVAVGVAQQQPVLQARRNEGGEAGYSTGLHNGPAFPTAGGLRERGAQVCVTRHGAAPAAAAAAV